MFPPLNPRERESPWYPKKTKVRRPQNPSGYIGQEKNCPRWEMNNDPSFV